MRIAYSYLRFSSAKQAAGHSIKRQSDPVQEICDENGWTLDTTLNIHDHGVSAWKGANAETGGLSVFLKLCEQGRIKPGSVLIVEHLDRLSRDHVRKALTIFMSILDAGVIIHTSMNNRTYLPESKNPLDLIEPLLLFTGANEFSDKLSDRVGKAWKDKRKDWVEKKKPMTAWCPHWIELKDGKYQLIPTAAKIIRRVVDLAIDGFGAIRICGILNSENIPPICPRTKSWSYSFITKTLHNPALIGDYSPGTEVDGKRVVLDKVWHDYYPAVITKDKWYQLKSSMNQRKTSDKNGNKRGKGGRQGEHVANLFSGIMINTRDGQFMQRIIKNHPRLISASFRNGLDGDTQSIPYQPVEQAIIQSFHHEIELDMILRNEQASEDNTAILEGQLIELEETIRATKDRIKGGKTVSSMLDLLAELDEQKVQLVQSLQDQKDKLINQGSEALWLSDLQAVQETAKADKQTRSRIQTRLRQLVDKIEITIHGQKRSKWKAANILIMFKGTHGCGFALDIVCEKEKLISKQGYFAEKLLERTPEKQAEWDKVTLDKLKKLAKYPS